MYIYIMISKDLWFLQLNFNGSKPDSGEVINR